MKLTERTLKLIDLGEADIDFMERNGLLGIDTEDYIIKGII